MANTYTVVASANRNSSGTSLTSAASSQAIPIGSSIIVKGGCGETTAGLETFTDSVGNTYTARRQQASAGGTATIWDCLSTTVAITTSTTFTHHNTNGVVDAFDVSVTSSAVTIDTGGVRTATGTAPITPNVTLTPAQADEIVVLSNMHANTNTVTVQATWTNDSNLAFVGNAKTFNSQSKILTTTAAVQGNGAWTASAVFAGAIELYKFPSATPATIAPAAGTVTFAGAVTIAAATLLAPAAANVGFACNGTLTAPTFVTIAASGVGFAGSGTVAYPRPIVPSSSGVAFGGTGSLTAPTAVSPAASGVSFAASGSLTGPTFLTGTGSVSFVGSGLVSRAQPFVPAGTGVSFSATPVLTAPTSVAFQSTGVSFAGSGALIAPGRVIGSSGVAFAGTGVITSIPQFSGATGIAFSGTGAITDIPRYTGTSGVAFTGTGAITAPGQITGTGTAAFAGTGTVTTPGSANIGLQASNVGFSGAGSFTAQPFLTGTGSVGFSGTGTLTSPALISFAPLTATFSASGSITAIPRISSSSGVSFVGSGAVTAPTQVPSSSSGVSFAGTGSISSIGAASISGSSGASFAGIGSLTAIVKVSGTAGVSFLGAGSTRAPALISFTPGTLGFGSTPVGLTTAKRLTLQSASVNFAGSGSLIPASSNITGLANVGFAALLSLSTPFLTSEEIELLRFRLWQHQRTQRYQFRVYLLSLLRAPNGPFMALRGAWWPLIPDLPFPDRDDLDDYLEEIGRLKLVANPIFLRNLRANWAPLIPDIPYNTRRDLDDDEQDRARMALLTPASSAARVEVGMRWSALARRERPYPSYDDEDDPLLGNWGSNS